MLISKINPEYIASNNIHFKSDLQAKKLITKLENSDFISSQVNFQYNYLLKNLKGNKLYLKIFSLPFSEKIFKNLLIFKKKIKCKNADNFILLQDGKILAGISCKKVAPDSCFLSTLFINPQAVSSKKISISRKLMEVLKDFQKENNISKFTASCAKINKKLLFFYKKIGFKVFKKSIFTNKLEISSDEFLKFMESKK